MRGEIWVKMAGGWVVVWRRRALWVKLAVLAVAFGAVLYGRLAGPRSAPAAAGQTPITRADSPDARLALTFDVTHGDLELQEVLAVLGRHGVRATFFVSHLWAANHPELVLALEEGGHEVGTLGFKLIDLTALSEAEVTTHLTRAQGLLFRILSRPVRLFRPPMGRWSPAVLAAARAAGLQTVTWRVDAGDGITPAPAPDAIVRPVLEQARRGDIVRLHASDFSRNSAEAVGEIIQALQERGFRLVPIRELMQ